MSTVLRGRAAQVDTALTIIAQAARACETAMIAMEEVEGLDDPAIRRDVILERLDTALKTISDALGDMELRREGIDE